MKYPVIVKNGVVGFSLLQAKPNGLPMEVTLESLFTKMGFVIPICSSSLNILDFIDHGEVPCHEQPASFRGLILSASGTLREYNFGYDEMEETGEARMKKISTRIPWDDKSMYVRAWKAGDDEILTAYGSVLPSAQEAITLFCKNYGCIQRGYLFVHLRDIMAELDRRECTHEFVVKHPGYLDLKGGASAVGKFDEALERIMEKKGML